MVYALPLQETFYKTSMKTRQRSCIFAIISGVGVGAAPYNRRYTLHLHVSPLKQREKSVFTTFHV